MFAVLWKTLAAFSERLLVIWFRSGV